MAERGERGGRRGEKTEQRGIGDEGSDLLPKQGLRQSLTIMLRSDSSRNLWLQTNDVTQTDTAECFTIVT